MDEQDQMDGDGWLDGWMQGGMNACMDGDGSKWMDVWMYDKRLLIGL